MTTIPTCTDEEDLAKEAEGHQERTRVGSPYCTRCSFKWPCPTVRLIAALRASRDEVDEYAQLTDRLSFLLTGTANALKGDPGPLTLHDWSDLPAVAAGLVARLQGTGPGAS